MKTAETAGKPNPDEPSRHLNWFVGMAGVVLSGRAGAKLWSSSGQARRIMLFPFFSSALVMFAAGPGLAAFAGAADGFGVDGYLDCTFFRSHGEVFTNQTLHFTIKVAGKKWQLTNFEGATNRWVRGSDGDSVYHLFMDASGRPMDIGIIEPGPMPWGGYPCAVVWLAFASADYLHDTDSMFGPWSDPYFEPSVLAYRLEVRKFESPPHLPIQVDFVIDANRVRDYATGRFIAREGVPFAAQAQAKERVASGGPPGFLGGRYSVLSFTNVGREFLPLEFELTAFRQTGIGRTTNTPVSATYRGRVTSCSPISMETGLPNANLPQRPVSVSDLRFRDNVRPMDSIHYVLTNRWITDAGDPGLLAMKAKKLASLPRFSSTDRRRYLILAVLAVVTLLPLLWAAFKGRRTERRAL